MTRKKRARSKSAASRGPDPRLLAAVLLLLSIGLYLNTLGHGFVFDDGALILQNSQVTGLRWGEMLGSQGYRPVRTFTYAVNYLIGGTDPFGYHLLNVLLHAANVLLLLWLLWRWTASPLAASAGAALFAAHPVQTAAVAYVSGRKDLLVTLFLLASLALYTRFRREGGWKFLAGSLALFVPAMLSKELAVVFPGLILLCEALLFQEDEGRSLTARVWSVLREFPVTIAAAAALGAAGAAYALLLTDATRMTGLWGGSLASNFGTSLKLFAHYLKLVVWPHPLIADYKGGVLPLAQGWTEPAALAGGVLLAGFVALAVWMARRLPLVSLGMLWFLLGLLPVLHLIPFHELAADHFLYFPLAGVAVIAARAAQAAEKRGLEKPFWGVSAVLLLLLAARTIDRNRDWKDTRTLWEATYADAPGSYRANANLGRFYFTEPGRRQLGLEMTRRAVELAPDDPVALSNLGTMHYLLGREAAAGGDLSQAERLAREGIGLLEQALALRRRDGSILTNLGSCHKLLAGIHERRVELAETFRHRRLAVEYFRKALARDRRTEIQAAWYNLAQLDMQRGRYGEAAESLRNYLKSRPNDSTANHDLATCLIRQGQLAEAVPHLQRSLQAGPSPRTYDLLAQVLATLGRKSEALQLLQQALRQFPSDPTLQSRLASLS